LWTAAAHFPFFTPRYMDDQIPYHQPPDALEVLALCYPSTIGLAIWVWCGTKRDLVNVRTLSKKAGRYIFVACPECDLPVRGWLRGPRFDPQRRISIPRFVTDVQEIIRYNDRCFAHSREWLRMHYESLIHAARARKEVRDARAHGRAVAAWTQSEYDIVTSITGEHTREPPPDDDASTTTAARAQPPPPPNTAGGRNYFTPETEEPLATVVWYSFGLSHRRTCPCSLCNRLREEGRLL